MSVLSRWGCVFLCLLLGPATTNAGLTRLVGWGDWIGTVTNGLPALTNITAISMGASHSLVLTAEGRVFAGGMNSLGQTNVPAGLSNVVAIAAGTYHCLALRNDGTVHAWGRNIEGQTALPAGLSNVVAIAAGDFHSVALCSDGSLMSWGQTVSPEVPPDCLDIVQIAAGQAYNLALRRDSTMIGWGGMTANALRGPTEVVELAARGVNSLARRRDGAVLQWGGSDPNGITTATIQCTGAVSIAAGLDQCLALKADGTVVAWGNNDHGQSAVPTGLNNARAIAAGQYCSIAVVQDGSPTIAVQPQDMSAFSGMAVSFRATVIGARPLTCRWQHNGVDMPAATNEVLTLEEVQPADAGAYSLTVSNSLGRAASSEALLTVQAGPPRIDLNPQDRSCLPGLDAYFSARVSGSGPMRYAWQVNGLDLPEATNTWLKVAAVTLTSEAYYRLVASNPFGTTTSSSALLTVADLAGALNARGLVWTNSGWQPQNRVSHLDGAALVANPISTSTLGTTVTGRCSLSFWWRVDGGGLLQFSIDHPSFSAQVGSQIPWQKKTFYLENGEHVLRWSFSSSYSQYAYLDEITVVPGGSPPLVTAPLPQLTVGAGTNVTLSVSVEGHGPLYYQWQFEGRDLAGATNSTLTISNVQAASAGLYILQASNPYGRTNATASLSVTPGAPAVWTQPVNQTAVAGGICVFAATVLGTTPAYQWFFNGNRIEGATRSTLVLSGLRQQDEGSYSLQASNTYGVVVSSNATLSLLPSKLIAWGANWFGECSVPATLSNVTAIAAGSSASAAVDARGRVFVWGYPWGSFSPVPTGAVAVAVGVASIATLQSNGLVTASSSALQPPPGGSNLVSISMGESFCAAVRQDRTVMAWGDNQYGQTNVPADLAGVLEVSCGPTHCLALKEDGSLVAWGNNSRGLANVPPEATNLLAIAAGGRHNLALRRDGVVLAWGVTNYASSFVRTDLTEVVAISAGPNSPISLALRSDGTVTVWGDNSSGQASLPFVATNVMAIAAGGFHCLALLGDGSPRCCRPLANQAADMGSTVILNASVVGNGPLQCQWQFNGQDLPGATQGQLRISNVSAAHAGAYRCRVSNSLGTVYTREADLVVKHPPLAFALQADALLFSHDGLHLKLLNLAGQGPVVIESSDDLRHWQPVLTNPPVMGTLQTIDPGALGRSQRFYRAHE